MYTDSKIKTYAAIDPNWPIGQDIVLCAGCFDTFHVGHLEHLEQARLCGNALVVCVGNDATVRELKGAGRPIIPAKQRARILAALSVVSFVVISEETGRMNFTRLVQRLHPQKLVVAADDPALEDKQILCEWQGVEMIVCERNAPETAPAGISTTQIVSQIFSSRV